LRIVLEYCSTVDLEAHESARFMTVEPSLRSMQATETSQDPVEKALSRWRLNSDRFGLVVMFSAILLGAYSAFPGIQNGIDASTLVPLIILAGAALLVSDVIQNGPEERTRLATISGIIGPLLIIAGLQAISVQGETHQLVGGIGWVVAGAILFSCHSFILQNENNIGVIRYRALNRLIGMAIAAAWILSNITEDQLIYFLLPVLFVSIIFSLDLRLGKEDRQSRKLFSNKYDSLMLRVLEVRATGAIIDQSASLLKRANEVGWTDYDEGMRLLAAAEDDIDRILSLSRDISDIEEDAEEIVVVSEGIAPMAERPRKAMIQGKREAELGSLREAEKLFRMAKVRALDIINHWEDAEKAIQEARDAISGLSGSDFDRMQALMEAAEDAMDAESPGDALNIAQAIPGHVSNLGEAMEAAKNKVEEATEVLSRTDGLDTGIWDDMLANAISALEEGDGSMARGLADSIIREITATEEAKSSMQRALRQRKTLRKRWEGHQKSDEWEERLQNILVNTKEGKWRLALEKMEALTSDLDAMSAAEGEAKELLDFINEEWKNLRNRLESSGIGPGDKDRLSCEASISKAKADLDSGDVESCLGSLGESDALMERLRRRV